MREILAFFLLCAASISAQCPDFSAAGPYETAYRTIASIPSEDETMTNSRVYYPVAGGIIPASAVPCPIVTFGHGFMTSTDNYYSYAQHFASWGFVCIVPTISNPLLNPNHNYRARLMITAARYVMNLNFSTSDLFYGTLDANNWAFIGHSMGGSISLLAGDRYANYNDSSYHLHDTLRAIVAFGSPQSTPATVAARITTSVLILSGTEDNIAPWNDVRSAYWATLGSPNGAFAVISGANHTYFTDSYGHYLTDGTASITRDQQRAIARKHATAFLLRFQKNDTTLCTFSYALGDSLVHAAWMDTVEVQHTPLSIFDVPRVQNVTAVRVFPNPFNAQCTFETSKNTAFAIYDIAGKYVWRGHSTWQPSAETPAGVYLLKTENVELQSDIKKLYFVR